MTQNDQGDGRGAPIFIILHLYRVGFGAESPKIGSHSDAVDGNDGMGAADTGNYGNSPIHHLTLGSASEIGLEEGEQC